MEHERSSDGTRFLARLAEWTFLIYLVLLCLVQPLNFRYGGLQILFADLFFLVPLSLWSLAIIAKKVKIRFSKLSLYVGLFVGAAIISTIFSTRPSVSVVKLVGIVYLAAISVLTFNLSLAPGLIKKVLFAVLGGTVLTAVGTLTAVLGFYCGWDVFRPLLSHFGSLPPGNYPRVRSFFENANMACNFLNFGIAAILALFKTKAISRLIAIIALVLAGIAALFTVSPGLGGIALTLGVFYWAFERSRKPRSARVAIAASIVLSTFILISTLISPSVLFGSSNSIEPLYSVRVRIWGNSIGRAREHPLLGRGLGTNPAEFVYTTVSGYQQYLTDAHNAWLNLLGQEGIVGFSAFVLLCWYLWSISKFRLESPRLAKEATVLLALSCGFLGAFLFQNLTGSFEDARHLWVLIGLMAAAHATYSASPAPADDRGAELPSP